MIRHLKPAATIPAALLLLLVVWSPLPFGSVLPFDRSALQVGGFVALAIAVAGAGVGGLRRVRWPLVALVAVGVLGWVQSMAWPRDVTGLVSPRSVDVRDRAASVLSERLPAAETADEAVDGAPPGRVEPSRVAPSLAPAITRATAIHWWAITAAFAAAVTLAPQRSLRRLLCAGVIGAAVFQVVYGSDHWFNGLDTIWGVKVPGSVSRLRGTFVNPDHLALYLGMAVAVAVAWTWWAVRRLRYEGGLERRLVQVTPPILIFVMLFSGLAFTGSRAGMVALVVTLFAQTALLARHYRSRRMLAVGAAALLIGFGAVAAFGWQAGFGRFLETSAYDLAWNSRFTVYAASFSLWRGFPALGTGLGTFREALPLVQEGDLEGTWLHAHSDWLEMLVTGGALAVPVLVIGALVLVRRLLRVLERGRRSEDRAAGLAGLGIVSFVALFSLVDFGLTMPANAFVLAVLLGLAAGTPVTRPERRKWSRADDQPASG